MKKILLFICLVMMAVGAKADYTDAVTYTYNSSASTCYLKNYHILGNVQGKSISSMAISSITVDGTSQKIYAYYYAGKYRTQRLTETASDSPLSIYFHETRTSSPYNGSPGTSDNMTPLEQNDYYKHGFKIDFNRNLAKTYVIKGYIQYTESSTTKTVYFTLTIKPAPSLSFSSISSSGVTVYTGDALTITTNSKINAKRTYSKGGTNSNYVKLSKTSYTGSGDDSFTATCTKPGTYTVTISQDGNGTYFPCSDTRTITVIRKPNDLKITQNNKTIALTDGTASIALSSLYTTSSTGTVTPEVKSKSSIYGKALQEGQDYGFNNNIFYAKEAGTYVINLYQAHTDYYNGTSSPPTVTVTVTGGTRPYYRKTMSCVMNEIDLTPLDNAKVEVTIDGNTTSYCALDANWAANSRNLRYVKSSTTYANLPKTYLDDQIVLKTTDNAAVTSNKIVIGGSGEIVSNPVMSDGEKFDYVIPDKAAPQLASDRTITFSRSEGIPAVGNYATICLPFSVPANRMPAGYTFEKHVLNAEPKPTASPTRFSFAFQAVNSLEAGKPYIFKRNNESAPASLEISVPATECTFVTEPSYDDEYFYGTFVNLIEKDLHAKTATNPYNNGDASVSLDELDTFFDNIYDPTYKRVAYFLKQNGNEDEIRRAGSNVTMRPLRAYFRFNETDFPAQSKAKLMILHLDLDDDDSTTGIKSSRADDSGFVDVYTLSGIRVAKHREVSKALEGLNAGIYILSNGKKVSK